MKRALLVYGAFLVAGLAFLGWRLVKLTPPPGGLEDLEEPGAPRWERPADESLPFPYDLGGRIAAYRAFSGLGEGAEPRFWLKGNLQVIVDDDWNDGRPRYRMATLPRQELESLMRALALLEAAETADGIPLERRDRDGLSESRVVDRAKLAALIDKALEGRDRKPYTPQALEILSEPLTVGAATRPWPTRSPSLRSLLDPSDRIVTRPNRVAAILAEVGAGGDFEQDEVRARIRVRVLTDRP